MHSFGDAVKAAFAGHKITRNGWNGNGMFLFIIQGNCLGSSCDVAGVCGLETRPFLCMKTADNRLVPWTASQSDVLAHDWIITDLDD